MSELDQLSINALRFLAVDAVEKAKSGHPGAPLGDSPTVYLLFHEIMRHNPANSKWSNRDRFVLSNGHASAMLYGVLHLAGYKVSIEDLQQFRQYGSITPGHPEYGETDGVEVTTGPLGQGFAMGVGMAIAEKTSCFDLQPPGIRHRESLHVRLLWGRRLNGRGLARSRFPCRNPRPGQDDLFLR